MTGPTEQAELLDSPYVLPIDLDRTSTTPLYRQITQPLIDAIKEGVIKPGQRLENEVALSQRLNVSRLTARRALQELVNSGMLLRKRGAGTRVAYPHIQRQLGLSSLNDDLIKADHVLETQVLNYQVQFAGDHYASLLDCEPGNEVVRIKRLRILDNVPLAILGNVLPANVAPSFSDLSDHGLYECLKREGVTLVSALQTVGARSISEEESAQLNLETGAAVLTMTRTSYDQTGRIVEYASHVYDAARYNLTIPMQAEQMRPPRWTS